MEIIWISNVSCKYYTYFSVNPYVNCKQFNGKKERERDQRRERGWVSGRESLGKWKRQKKTRGETSKTHNERQVSTPE